MQITGAIGADSKVGKNLGLEQEISATVNVNFGGDEFLDGKESPTDEDYQFALQAAIEKFGARVVYSQFEDAAVVTTQQRVRTLATQIYAGKMTQEQAQAEANGWKLGVVTRRSSPEAKKAKIIKDVSKLGLADRQALLAALQAEIAAELGQS